MASGCGKQGKSATRGKGRGTLAQARAALFRLQSHPHPFHSPPRTRGTPSGSFPPRDAAPAQSGSWHFCVHVPADRSSKK